MKQTVAAIIVAAGSAQRFGTQKLFERIGSASVLELCAGAIARSELVDSIVFVCSEQTRKACELLDVGKPCKVVLGGETRVQSVKNGIAATDADFVCIHDCARPLVDTECIDRVVRDALEFGAAAVCIPSRDSIKLVCDGFLCGDIERAQAVLAQTPQVFKRTAYLAALQKATGTETDDCEIARKAGIKIKLTDGSQSNMKITYPEDIKTVRSLAGASVRVGYGWDLHRLENGRELWLCGVKIPYEKGLLGHSDADAPLHAVIDALLGAAALGDIGEHFPDTDERFRGASSAALLKQTVSLLSQYGFAPMNIDVTVVAQQPKLSLYKPQMAQRIAQLCGVNTDCVSVKAKTCEGLGPVGTGLAIEAHAAVSVEYCPPRA